MSAMESSQGPLVGKAALVTGGARGIGRSIALRLAEKGASVTVVDVASGKPLGPAYKHGTTDDLEQTKAEIEAIGGKVITIVGDVRKSADLAGAAEKTLAEFGSLDIVVCNAGVLCPSKSYELAEEDWDRVVDVNLKGVWLTTKHTIPHMIKQNRGGRIMIISSVGGIRASTGNIAYSASKFGVIGIAKSLAQELGEHRITVNTVHPGVVDTPLLRSATEVMRNHAMSNSVLGVILEGRDIANAVAWLASDEARYVTGHTMVVDGGFLVKTT
jgi:(+)-trans-carveol dehydrogenase